MSHLNIFLGSSVLALYRTVVMGSYVVSVSHKVTWFYTFAGFSYWNRATLHEALVNGNIFYSALDFDLLDSCLVLSLGCFLSSSKEKPVRYLKNRNYAALSCPISGMIILKKLSIQSCVSTVKWTQNWEDLSLPLLA